jgi:hypothetical protein
VTREPNPSVVVKERMTIALPVMVRAVESIEAAMFARSPPILHFISLDEKEL